MSGKPQKSSAASRTIDLFTQLTQEQVAKQAQAEKEALEAQEDVQEAPKAAEPIEVSAEVWRENALKMQTSLSKSFGLKEPQKGVYRLTEANRWMFLEQFRQGKDGSAFHWAGVMFPASDLYEVTSVFVRASKERQSAEGKGK